MELFYIAFLLMTTMASASELVLAKRMPQSLDTRASFYGAWPIAATTCPSNTTSCGDGSCCPSGTDCYTAGLAGVAVCCPNTNDCSNTANTLPVCADSSWTLYIGNYYYFCCAPGQVGILPNKGDSVAAGLCVESNVSPAASLLATPYAAASATTASATTASSTTASSTTASSSSSTPSATSTTPSSTTGPTSTPSSTNKPSANSSPNSVSLSMSATSSSTTLTTSSTSQPSNSAPASTSSTGAIAGGVVGGVIGLTLIVLAIWFFGFRRQKNRAITPAETSDAAGPIEKNPTVRDQELNEIPGPMAGNFGYSEMAAPEVLRAEEGNIKFARMSPAELA